MDRMEMDCNLKELAIFRSSSVCTNLVKSLKTYYGLFLHYNLSPGVLIAIFFVRKKGSLSNI